VKNKLLKEGKIMTQEIAMDKTFRTIMDRFLETGQGPHFTEIAAKLGISPEAGKKALHELFFPMFPGWLSPNTDYISTFPPFSNLPTQYRITIEGQQKWFGQWGFESLAVSWLFQGKVVQIDAPCLDCGSPIRVRMKDGVLENTEPDGLVAYTPVPFREWFNNLPYAWSTMNLFRSEEDVRGWSGFKVNTEEGIIPVPDMVTVFSNKLFTRRLDPDYMAHFQEYITEFIGAVGEIGKLRPFWSPVSWRLIL
jgi:hypothetical protein